MASVATLALAMPAAQAQSDETPKVEAVPGSTEDQVVSLVAEQLALPRENVSLDSSFVDDLGADSLSAVALVLALEERFEIEIPDAEVEKLATVREVVAFIDRTRKP